MTETEILARLIGFDTTSRNSNLGLIGFVSGLLQDAGLTPELFPSADGTKASLLVSTGPAGPGGILLSAHSDTVPVDGQHWTGNPFLMAGRDSRLFGRGTADMKGFVACAVAAVMTASARDLKQPVHFALSYDEEVGCTGVRPMLEILASRRFRPDLCLVGEPTEMAIATGHKGKRALRALCTGEAGHSAQAPEFANAIHLGADLVGLIRQLQADIIANGARDPGYDIPYTTLHAGIIRGGSALNIVPDACLVDFEIRNIAADDPDFLTDRIRDGLAAIVAPAKASSPGAGITLETLNAYPGLSSPDDCAGVGFLRSCGGTSVTRIGFGTEGGLIARAFACETLVCGPGNIAQAHKADEFVSLEQIAKCVAMMDRIVDAATAGSIPNARHRSPGTP